jgi:hypothetical protein
MHENDLGLLQEELKIAEKENSDLQIKIQQAQSQVQSLLINNHSIEKGIQQKEKQIKNKESDLMEI